MNSHLTAVFQALFVVFLWGTSWVFIKVGLQSLPPLTFAGLRYFLAFGCLIVVLLFSEARKELTALPKQVWARLLILGIIYYAGTQGASFVALAYLPAVTVNLLWSFSSVVVALLGIAWLSETPTPFQWAGIGLAILGAFVYFFPVAIPQAPSFGVVAAIIGVVANALSSILGRDINRAGRYSPLLVTVISMGAGSIVLLATGLSLEQVPTFDFRSWVIILWLAVANTAFAFTLWNHTLRNLTAIESSIINGTMLIWIPIFAVLFLSERITSKEIVGVVAVGIGTIIVQLRRFPRGTKAAD